MFKCPVYNVIGLGGESGNSSAPASKPTDRIRWVTSAALAILLPVAGAQAQSAGSGIDERYADFRGSPPPPPEQSPEEEAMKDAATDGAEEALEQIGALPEGFSKYIAALSLLQAWSEGYEEHGWEGGVMRTAIRGFSDSAGALLGTGFAATYVGMTGGDDVLGGAVLGAAAGAAFAVQLDEALWVEARRSLGW